MARSNWEGFIKLSLISVPVKAYTATATSGGKIHFHQLHSECHSRIKYQKVCPIHGEVNKDEIVSGYEYAKGEYVVVDPEEMRKLVAENDRAVNIELFIPPDAIDPVYYSGKTYYLVPDGPAGGKSYAVLYQVMADQNRYALARVILSGKEEMTILRPVDGVLALSVLSYASQVKQASGFRDEVPEVKVSATELKLAETLIETSSAAEVDYAQYKDEYTDKLVQLIEAKAAGKRITAPRAHEEPAVINLMDALRRSLDKTQRQRPDRKGGKAGKSAGSVAHARKVHKAPTRRKTG